MKIVTHDSRFHTDDVFAVATLLLVFPESEIIRSRDLKVQAGADILVDTGMQYNPAKMIFDHHQPGGAGERSNGIPYASFGLVWKEFGAKLAGSTRAGEMIEKKLVEAVDARDNGMAVAEPKFEDIREYSIGDFFNSFVESRDPDSLYRVFLKVVEIAKGIILREIEFAKKFIVEEGKVLSYYDKSSDKRLVVMEEDLVGWKEVLRNKPDVLYVVYPRPDGKWSLATVQSDDYVSRKPLPAEWAGLKDEELEKVSGVEGALFCHGKLFMAATNTKEAAIKLAEIALNS